MRVISKRIRQFSVGAFILFAVLLTTYHRTLTGRLSNLRYLSQIYGNLSLPYFAPASTEVLEPENPSLVYMTSQAEFDRRGQRVKDVCLAMEPVPGRVSGVFTDESSGVIYCMVPKTGCTFWKRVFNFVNNKNIHRIFKNVFSIPRHFVHSLGNANGTPYNGTGHNSERYPTRLIVARNPISRIVSSYMDKMYLPDLWQEEGVQLSLMTHKWAVSRRLLAQRFEHSEQQRRKGKLSRGFLKNGTNRNFRQEMKEKRRTKIEKLRKSPSSKLTDDKSSHFTTEPADFLRKHFNDMAAMFNSSFDRKRHSTSGAHRCGKYLTFSEFLRASTFRPEPHWLPVHEICNPCQFMPTHVSKMESFTPDARVVLAEMGLEKVLDDFDNVAQINEELSMLVDYHFTRAYDSAKKKFYLKCITPKELAYRLWKNFQWRGYIHPEVTYKIPAFTEQRKIKRDLLTQIWSAREMGLKEPDVMKKSKENFINRLFSTVSPEVLETFIWKFRIDFKLFEYEDKLENFRRIVKQH